MGYSSVSSRASRTRSRETNSRNLSRLECKGVSQSLRIESSDWSERLGIRIHDEMEDVLVSSNRVSTCTTIFPSVRTLSN